LAAAVLTPSEFAQIADTCAAIANDAADDTGFVPVRDLLSRFRARLLIRPLLVEGMLASLSQPSETLPNGEQWAVLVDEEKYRVTEADVAAEICGRALPTRLRNTIAHELTHTFAFQPSALGVKLRTKFDTDKARSTLLQEIERQTERLSPLLLWPKRAIAALLLGKDKALAISDLTRVRKDMGISRDVLITRLKLLQENDPDRFLFSHGLRNLAVGIAEWGQGSLALIRARPLFSNFDRNTAPAFVHSLSNKNHLWANDLFDAPDLVMCGGRHTSLEVMTGAGTAASPNAQKMRIEVAVEDRERRPGRPFLFAVRGQL